MEKSVIGIIPDICDIERTMKLTEEYGVVFEYNDFMLPRQLDQTEECRRKIEINRGLGRDRSQDTFHGAFLDLAIHSQDAMIREISRKRIYQSMEIAQELDVRGVVFHSGLVGNFYAPYYWKRWVEKNVEFWTRVLEDFPHREIYIENMFDEDEQSLAELGKALESQDRFGICLDYAHAMAFGDAKQIERWFQGAAPYIRHMHINDNNLKEDLHLPLGQGTIDWEQFGSLMRRYGVRASVLLEVAGEQAQRQSLEYIREHHIL